MMAGCAAFDPAGPYVGQVLALVDCQTQGVAQAGWQALSGTGGWLSGLLVIAVALAGYRLMLGGRIGLGDGAGLVLRIGVVLALCTQWAAWDALAFRVGTQEPEVLAAAVLGADGSALATRLDRMGATLEAVVAASAPQDQPGAVVPSIEEKKSLASAQTVITASALAGLIAVRCLVALLLAVGPLFVGSLLFATTRGMLAGWLRAMVGAMLAAVAVPMVLGLELAVVEPQVASLAAMVGGTAPLGGLVAQLWTSACVFALALAAVALGAARAAAFRFPDGARVAVEHRSETLRQEREVRSRREGLTQGAALPAGRSRAQRMADTVMQAQRREERSAETRIMRQELTTRRTQSALAPVPLGQQAIRRGARRASPGAARRDGVA